MSHIEIAKKLLAELDARLAKRKMDACMDEYGVQDPLFNYPLEETPIINDGQEYEAQNDAGEMDK